MSVREVMVNILISGALGKMGQVVANTVKNTTNCKLVAGFDTKEQDMGFYHVYSDINAIDENIDVIIDFSNPLALDSVLSFALKNRVALVLCTTGYSKNDEDKIKEASSEIAVFYSGNMSLGVNLLIELCKKACMVLDDSFDIEIIEQHHNQKIDAPSGTALMIADAISEQRNNSKYAYDRHSVRKKRDKNEIGIHSVRAGNIVGEHQVIFSGNDEVITISHSARSKQIFATGAVNAAKFIKGRQAGMYSMKEMLK